MPRSGPARISKHVVSYLRSSATKPYSHVLQLHALMVKSALDLLPFPTSLLLSSAAACGGAAPSSAAAAAFLYARAIFRRIPAPDLFQYNTMLRSYAALAPPHHLLLLSEALDLFITLMATPLSLDQFPFVSVLKLSARCRALPLGKQVHGLVTKSGFDVYPNVRNTLIHVYCCCGEIHDAHNAFDEMPQRQDAVTCAVLINGYVQVSETKKAMSLFRGVVSSCSGVNVASVVSALSASVESSNSLWGECLHGYCVKIGFCSELNVATAITTMYTKFGCMGSARNVFDSVHRRDLVLYNCMVDGYAKEGLVEDSLGLIEKMRREGVKPNSSTFVGLLSACASSGALIIGRRIHEYVEGEDLELDSSLGTALVDMYSKAGCIDDAIKVFNEIPERDVKAWTAMIMGFGFHGQAEAAHKLFYRMESEKVLPNEVTFLAVLSACSHGGLVEEAKKCFEKMVREYKLSPKPEHYGCVIDLLGRAGRLEEAHELIKGLLGEADAMAWRALLAACRVHGNVELGETVRRYLVGLGDEHPADSVILSSTYASAGRWEAIAKAREFEGREMVKKEAGCSSIEMAS